MDNIQESENKEDRLGNCEVCGVNSAKYTCPKCEVKTCSVKCVNIHKKELECDGSRNRTKFVSLRQFTNIDVLSDYRLLEEITRSVETIKKDKSKYFTRHNNLPRHLFKLKMSLLNRGTNIRFLPANFERHKRNTSYVDFKSGEVFWHIEWRFMNADSLRMEDEKCSESLKLGSILYKYLNGQSEESVNESLQFYQSIGLNGIALYLKAENKPGERFFRLDPSADLKENFRSKTIIEFPIIHVVLKHHCDMYDTIDSDDEVKTNVPNHGNKVLAQLLSSAEKEQADPSQNLLFALPFAEEQMSEDE